MGRHGAGGDRRRPRSFPSVPTLLSAIRRLLHVRLVAVADGVGLAPSSITRLELGEIHDHASVATVVQFYANLIVTRNPAEIESCVAHYETLAAGTTARALRRLLTVDGPRA
jgi:hypothetical protein